MKTILICLALVFSQAGFAKPAKSAEKKKPAAEKAEKTDRNPSNMQTHFSAFISGGQLYITVLADRCNYTSNALTVDDFCKKSRRTRNAVVSCGVELTIDPTEMGCDTPGVGPVVINYDISKTEIDPNAKELVLKFQYGVVRVPMTGRSMTF